MKKIKNIDNYINKSSKQDFYKTNYDNLFDNKIRTRGINYYISDRVSNITYNNNIIKTKVRGTKNYNVIIKIINNKKIDVKCNCTYHQNSNIYCKHVYASLVSTISEGSYESLIDKYNKNKEKLIDISNKINELSIINKKYLDTGFLYTNYEIYIKNLDYYKNYMKELESSINEKTHIGLKRAVNNSYYYLNSVIDDYNRLIDHINYGKKVYNKKQEDDTISVTYSFDDSYIFNELDDKIANVPLEVLEKVKKENARLGEDNEIIDKAIEERIKRGKLIKEKKEITKCDNKISIMRAIYNLFFKNSNNKKSEQDYLFSKIEQEEIDKGNYELYQFDEEDLEDDDYYFEDID